MTTSYTHKYIGGLVEILECPEWDKDSLTPPYMRDKEPRPIFQYFNGTAFDITRRTIGYLGLTPGKRISVALAGGNGWLSLLPNGELEGRACDSLDTALTVDDTKAFKSVQDALQTIVTKRAKNG
jgi:hypothetical protein